MKKKCTAKIMSASLASLLLLGSMSGTTIVFAKECVNPPKLILEETKGTYSGISGEDLLQLWARVSETLGTEQHQKVAALVALQMQPLHTAIVEMVTAPSGGIWDYDAAAALYDKILYHEARFHAAIDFDNIVEDSMNLEGEHLDARAIQTLQTTALTQQEWFLFFRPTFTVEEISHQTNQLQRLYNTIINNPIY